MSRHLHLIPEHHKHTDVQNCYINIACQCRATITIITNLVRLNMFVTEFGGPYQSSGLRPISIAMFDLIHVDNFERQYLENGKGYKGNGFKTVRQWHLALEAVKICDQHCLQCPRGGAKNPTFNENVEIVANFFGP